MFEWIEKILAVIVTWTMAVFTPFMLPDRVAESIADSNIIPQKIEEVVLGTTEEMEWLSSYETIEFNTVDGDLAKNEYAVDPGGGYYIRTSDKDKSQFEWTDDITQTVGKTLVTVKCHKCKYYSEFLSKNGVIVREAMVKQDYDGLKETEDYPQPTKLEFARKYPPLFPKRAHAAIGFDATSTAGVNLNASSVSFSHTTSGSDRGLIIAAGCADTTEADRDSTATYNSVSATLEIESDAGGSQSANSTHHSLINPASGANTVAITYGGTCTITSAHAISFTGANQSDLVEATASSSATNSDTVSTNVTTVTADAWVVDSAHVNVQTSPPLNPTVGAGQTQRWNTIVRDAGSDNNSIGSTEGPVASPSSVTMSWTLSGGNDDHNHAVSVIKPTIAAVTGDEEYIILFE